MGRSGPGSEDGACFAVRAGVEGSGDVDSGPVIFGASPAGTGFAIAGARLTHDEEFLQQMLRTSEFVGFTWSWRGRRQYLSAPLVGDAIMLAMLTVVPWEPLHSSGPVSPE